MHDVIQVEQICVAKINTHYENKFSPAQRNVAFRLHWNLFEKTMTSLTESFNPLKHTPFYQNEKNEREILQ